MGSAAKGLSGLGQEFTNSGLQSRLPTTLISALPVSLTTAIPGTSTNGERLVAFVYNHTTAGTLGFAGTAPLSQAALSETSSSIPTMELPGEVAIYATTNVFGAISASGITLGSGLTGGSVVLMGVQAANRLVVGEVKLTDKWTEHSTKEQRGLFDEDFNLQALAEEGEWEVSQDFYADDALFGYLGGYAGNATVTSIPAAAVVIHASASVVTSGNESASSQPTAPGMVIQCVIGGAPATAATVTITGTNPWGETVIEVVVPSSLTAGTYTSSNVFATIAASGIAWGAFGGSATLTVNAFFGWKYSGNPSDTLASFALEQYDSTGSFIAPYCLVNEWTLEGGADKEAKFSAKGPAQNVFPVGNPATTTNQVTAFSQVLDKPSQGFRALVTIDGLAGTFGTTQNQDVIDWKITTALTWKGLHTSWGNPPTRMWKVAYRNRRKVTIELTLDMTSGTYQNEYQAWKQRKKRLTQIQLIGPFMGTASAVNYNEGFVMNFPVRWTEEAARDFSTGKDSVEVKLKGTVEYSQALGYGHQYTWYTHVFSW